MGNTVGIDLGTTNCAIARLDDRGRPYVLTNAEGSSTTPSVICFLDERTVIGEEAKELQAAGVGEVVAFFKRQMGDPNFIFHANGRDWSATELSALLLRRLKEDAEATLGEPVSRAVITVPAYFRNPQREATREAGRLAGLEVMQLVNEPTAAALAYGLRQGEGDQGNNLLVYDLGGGTFDLTLMEIEQTEIRIVDSEGDHELGGKDWDDRIVQFVASRFEEEFGIDPISEAVSLTELLAHAEQAKRHLTRSVSARITLDHGGERGTYVLDRVRLEEICADLMERTVALTTKVLSDSGVRPEEVDGVLLVGGSTRMPMVHDFITRQFGEPPMSGVNVDEAVALGAAILAADCESRNSGATERFSLGGRRAVDVTNHSLGMIAVDESGAAYLNSVILPKNQPIPCTQTRPYQFRNGGDNRLEIFMTQGESSMPGEVTYIGQYVIDSVPHGQNGIAILDIGYAYDESGTVEVTATARDGGIPLTVRMDPIPGDVPRRFLSPPPPRPAPPHVTIYLTFDLSGSMGGAPLREAKRAAHRFVEQSDLSHCSIGVLVVADTTDTVLKATQNARKIGRAIDSLSISMVGYGNGAHPFDDLLTLLRRDSGPRYAVVLADGVWSRQDKAIERARRCHAAGIEIVAVGFGSADRAFLKAIATSDEGSLFTSLNGLAETFGTIAQVLTETAGGTQGATRGGLLGLLRK